MMKIFRQLNPTSLHPITHMYAVKNTTVDGKVSVNQPSLGFSLSRMKYGYKCSMN